MCTQESEIKKFFKNQTIFLTGGTGFLGKIVLEKLLRVCDEVVKIYVLIRPKKNKTAEERFEEIFTLPCFELIQAKKEVLQKVTLVSGDCQKPLLGLKEQDLTILKKETTCVIHAAANVKFDQTLKEASYIVRAIRDLLELAKDMPKLKAFLYVSTAYSNCIEPEIREEFYQPPLQAEDLLALTDILDDEIRNFMTPKLLGEWPNTYVFAKCIAEDLVRSAGANLPISILRPAIITNAADEPVPGWVDNFYGLAGVTVGCCLGAIRSLYAIPEATAKTIPVDYVANCALAIVWKTAQNGKTVVYNLVGRDENQITWDKIAVFMRRCRWKFPAIKTIWYPEVSITKNKLWHKIRVFCELSIPAHVIDLILCCLGKPRFVVKNCKRLNDQLDLTYYFTARQWRFQDDNVTDLWDSMAEEDKKLFNFNLEKVDWYKYSLLCLHGGRRFLMKDTLDTVPKAKRKLLVLFVLHYSLIMFLWFLLYKFVVYILSFVMG